MMLRLCSKAKSSTNRARLSTAAATMAANPDSGMPSYVLSAAAPTVSTLANGVRVCSLVDGVGGSSPHQHVTVRISNVGSRYDVKGGEASLLASSLLGTSGREFVSLSSLANLAAPSAAALDGIKAKAVSDAQGRDAASQMMDRLHETAFQGDGLANSLLGTTESIQSVTQEDLGHLVSKIRGEDVVVVATGEGSHDRLLEEAEKALGGLSGGGSKEVGSVKGKPYFVGSDIR
jgi:hypothetical protein